jgi:hypothetical protein
MRQRKSWKALAGGFASAILLGATEALAGAGGAAPGGGAGGSGSEPEMIALVLFSLVPGIYFARRAVATRKAAEV